MKFNALTFKLLGFFLCTFYFSGILKAQCPSAIQVSTDGSKTLSLSWNKNHEKPLELLEIDLDGKTYKGAFQKDGSWRTKPSSVFSSNYTKKMHTMVVYGVEGKYENGIYLEPEIEYLISYTVQNVNNQMIMNWIVMKGSKHSHYIIERRLRDMWITVDSIPASAVKTKASSVYIYEYIDQTPPSGDLIYRAKSVKSNKRFSVSELVTISNYGGKLAKLTRIDPMYRFEQETMFEVFSIGGELIMRGKGNFIDFSEIGRGTFSVKYSGNSTKIVYN